MFPTPFQRSTSQLSDSGSTNYNTITTLARGRSLLFPSDDVLREEPADRLTKRTLDALILPQSTQGTLDCAHYALPAITKTTSNNGVFSALTNPDKKSTRPIVICIHDIGNCGVIFSSLCADLGKHYSQLIVDLPGRGNSRGTTLLTNNKNEPITQRYVRAVLDCMNVHGIDHLQPVHVVGHGMGAMIALEIATMVNALSIVLLAPAGVMQPPLPLFHAFQILVGLPFVRNQAKKMIPAASTQGDILFTNEDAMCKRLESWISQWCETDETDAQRTEFVECIAGMPMTSNHNGVKRAATILKTKSTCRVLLLYSQNDSQVKLREDDLIFYRDTFGNDLLTVENIQAEFPHEPLGHCFFLQRAKFVNKKIEAFFVAQDKCG